jgi:hypothetical protein
MKVSNCEQVKEISTKIRNSGNKYIFGIIDYDGKNITNAFVKVLGDGKRYSIENFIFDPILVSALLLREKICTKEQFGLNEEESYLDIKNFNQDKLQSIVDIFISMVIMHKNTDDDTLIPIQLVNRLVVNIPNWYLQFYGHDLENKVILNTFQALSSIKKGKEELLKIAIIDYIIDDLPTLISIDFVDAFQYIQHVD